MHKSSCRSENQDARNGSAPLNKMATRAKNRKSSNDTSSLANGLISNYLHRSALYQTLLKWFCLAEQNVTQRSDNLEARGESNLSLVFFGSWETRQNFISEWEFFTVERKAYRDRLSASHLIADRHVAQLHDPEFLTQLTLDASVILDVNDLGIERLGLLELYTRE